MNSLRNIVLFLAVFLVAGMAIHYGTFGKFGLFVWSIGNGGLERSGVPEVATGPGTGENGEKSDGEGRGPSGSGKGKGEASGESGKGGDPVVQPPADPGRVVMFGGKDLGKWKKTEFGGEGEVFVNEDNNLEFGFGAIMTGVHWGEEPPSLSNYELSLEAMKLDGNDFFAAITFPVKDSHASFVIGGWGGGVVGLSSVDDLDASENETMNIEGFEDDVWYKIRIRVTDDKIRCWIDEREMVDLDLKDRKISLRPGDIELCVPVGIASFQTRAQYRNIIWRKLESPEDPGESSTEAGGKSAVTPSPGSETEEPR